MLALLFSGGSAILFIVFYRGYELRGTPNAVHNRKMCSDTRSFSGNISLLLLYSTLIRYICQVIR